MKRITIVRKNDFVSSMQTICVFINDKKYFIDINSSTTIEIDDKEIKVYAKLQWMRTRVFSLSSSEQEYKITVRPFIDNSYLKVALFLFIISIFFIISENSYLDLVAQTIIILMLVVYVYSFTIGYRNYLKLEINKIF